MEFVLLVLIITLSLSFVILFRVISPDLFIKLGLIFYCYYVKDIFLTLTYNVFTRIYNVLDVLFLISARIGNSISRVKKQVMSRVKKQVFSRVKVEDLFFIFQINMLLKSLMNLISTLKVRSVYSVKFVVKVFTFSIIMWWVPLYLEVILFDNVVYFDDVAFILPLFFLQRSPLRLSKASSNNIILRFMKKTADVVIKNVPKEVLGTSAVPHVNHPPTPKALPSKSKEATSDGNSSDSSSSDSESSSHQPKQVPIIPPRYPKPNQRTKAEQYANYHAGWQEHKKQSTVPEKSSQTSSSSPSGQESSYKEPVDLVKVISNPLPHKATANAPREARDINKPRFTSSPENTAAIKAIIEEL